jgi:hypothetical protein
MGDTAQVSMGDTTASTANSGDSAAVQVQADTTTQQAQVSAPTEDQTRTDTVAAVTGDSAGNANGQSAGVADNAGRVRPPEDSTEVLGNVTTDSSSAGNANVASKSDTVHIRPPEDSAEVHGSVTSDEDRAAVSSRDADTSAAGAAAVGSTVTGAEAVALMDRAGERCVLLNEESTEAAWDISDSPADLNPCGPGTMTLSPVRTGEKH